MMCEVNDLPSSYLIIGGVSGDGTGVLSPEAVEYFTVTPAQGGKEREGGESYQARPFLSLNWTHHQRGQDILYSGKFSRENTFTFVNFKVFWLFTKVFSAKFWGHGIFWRYNLQHSKQSCMAVCNRDDWYVLNETPGAGLTTSCKKRPVDQVMMGTYVFFFTKLKPFGQSKLPTATRLHVALNW